MRKLIDLLFKNKIYLAMVLFIIALNALIYVDKRDHRSEVSSEESHSGEKTKDSEEAFREEESPASSLFPDEQEIKLRQEKLLALASENPKLYFFLGIFNMMMLYVIFGGVILNVILMIRAVRRQPISISGGPPAEAKWTLGDVIRVVLIFLTSGYAFIIVQALAAPSVPILYNDNFRMVFNTAVINIVGISVILYFVRRSGQGPEALGITRENTGRNIGYAALGYLALIPVLLVIMLLTYQVTRIFHYEPPVQPIVEVFMKEKETSVLVLSTIFAAVFGPVAEEIFFRGFMYPAVRKSTGRIPAMVITSAVFAFLHAHLVGFLPIFVLGMLLVYLFERTASIVPSVLVHIFHNVAMVAFVFVMRAAGIQ
ncbi:MAG: type II CAAX endopeptidase family protein [Candidatus Omnitrophica bacterium]|nr:type II CAAX endopeptidase family protein [Candidatus Omnitrophota bacterium]